MSMMMQLFKLKLKESVNLTFDFDWIGDPNSTDVQPMVAGTFEIHINKPLKKTCTLVPFKPPLAPCFLSNVKYLRFFKVLNF